MLFYGFLYMNCTYKPAQTKEDTPTVQTKAGRNYATDSSINFIVIQDSSVAFKKDIFRYNELSEYENILFTLSVDTAKLCVFKFSNLRTRNKDTMSMKVINFLRAKKIMKFQILF